MSPFSAKRPWLPILALLVCGGMPVRADVYTFVGEDGVAHYANAAIDARYQPVVELLREMGGANRAGALPAVPGKVGEYAPHVEHAAAETGVDQALIHAVIMAESAYNPRAVSRVGAQGMMQLMPATARRYGVADAFDPRQNILGGARYLRDLLALFDNDHKLAVAAYNAGEHTVLRYGRKVPPYPETLAYVPRVLRLYERLASTRLDARGGADRM